VEQELDHHKQLSSIINDPDRLRHSDIPLLKELVAQHPYFQPLRLILAKLSMETEDAEQTLTTTALYTNGAVLHQFLHRKAVVQEEAVSGIAAVPLAAAPGGIAAGSGDEDVVEGKSIFDEAAELEAASLLEEVYAFGDTDPNQPEEIDCVEEVNDSPTDDQETYEEIAEINIHDYERPVDHNSADDYTSLENLNSPEDPASADNEESTFEEISEVNIHDYEVSSAEKTGAGNAPVIETLEDNFVENIAATDFFTFEEKFIAEDKASAEYSGPTTEQADSKPEPQFGGQGLSLSRAASWIPDAGSSQTEKDTNEITNYDDDSLPYTFLWWLAKTRKEHSTIFQPYATPKKQTQNELHQQYVEHIFHIQSPFNAEEILNNVPEHQADPKDAKIIDEFIKKDPQITPPRPEQIDNENKAKRSAEDHNDLVSETLAKIYIEQMLYHKAIDTYEKLSLKFPEKSRYFADLIQSIKKKI
jgi:hypothetical protein